jgi:hypothetical protein
MIRLLTILVVLAFGGIGCSRSVVPESAYSQQYRLDVEETARLVSFYSRHWHEKRSWPEPNAFTGTNFVYKGTETNSVTHPNSRRDFYRTDYDSGRELDVVLTDDGTVEVKVFSH